MNIITFLDEHKVTPGKPFPTNKYVLVKTPNIVDVIMIDGGYMFLSNTFNQPEFKMEDITHFIEIDIVNV